MSVVTVVMGGWKLIQLRRSASRSEIYRELAGFTGFRHLEIEIPPGPDTPDGSLSPYANQLLEGQANGFNVRVFEHLEHYRDPDSTLLTQTMVEVSCRGWRPPAFELYPKTFAARWLNRALKRAGIVLIGDHAFARANFLFSKEPGNVLRCFSTEVTAPFRDNRKWYVDGDGAVVRVYRSETLLTLREIRRAVKLGLDMAAALRETDGRTSGLAHSPVHEGAPMATSPILGAG